MLRTALTGCAFVLLTNGAMPAPFPFGGPCTQPPPLAELKDLYESIADFVEAVPPSEAEYIRNEERAAFDKGNEARFELVFSNQFYHALHVRDGVDEATGYISAAISGRYSGTVDGQVSALIDALQVAGALTSSVSEYIDFDARRPQPVLSKDDRVNLSARMELARSATADTAKCLLKEMVASQSE